MTYCNITELVSIEKVTGAKRAANDKTGYEKDAKQTAAETTQDTRPRAQQYCGCLDLPDSVCGRSALSVFIKHC